MLVLFIVYFELILLLRFKLAACSRAKHDEHSAALGSPPTPPRYNAARLHVLG